MDVTHWTVAPPKGSKEAMDASVPAANGHHEAALGKLSLENGTSQSLSGPRFLVCCHGVVSPRKGTAAKPIRYCPVRMFSESDREMNSSDGIMGGRTNKVTEEKLQ